MGYILRVHCLSDSVHAEQAAYLCILFQVALKVCCFDVLSYLDLVPQVARLTVCMLGRLRTCASYSRSP